MTQCSSCEALTSESKSIYSLNDDKFYYCDYNCKRKIIEFIEVGKIIPD